MVSIRRVFEPPAVFNFSHSLTRISPEPRSSLSSGFWNVLSGVSSLLNGAGSTFTGLNSEYAGLIQLQLETQKQMMLMSAYSNIEKSKHETQMAAVRNIRVG